MGQALASTGEGSGTQTLQETRNVPRTEGSKGASVSLRDAGNPHAEEMKPPRGLHRHSIEFEERGLYSVRLVTLNTPKELTLVLTLFHGLK